MKKKNTKYLVILLSVAILIGVGYAALSATLNITGQTTIEKASWDIHFENLEVTSGSVAPHQEAVIDVNKTTVNFGIILNKPGEFYEFSVDVVNKGTIDAMISEITKIGLTEEQSKYLNYIVEYTSGVQLLPNQLLETGTKEVIKVRVEFRSDLDQSDLPVNGEELNLSFSLNYIQADDSAVAISHPVCKRATQLHTEICNYTNTTWYCSASGYPKGDEITYGSLGTSGTLTSGDAFDCDVNGDLVYNSDTERFYYVSDYYNTSTNQFDTNYATLIYYNNISGGDSNSTATYAYNTDDSNYLGPQIARLELPTTSKWSNISLLNSMREILDNTNIIKTENFDYSGYSARLLTIQEVETACGKGVTSYKMGYLNNCEYLLQNTNFSDSGKKTYWLETYVDANFPGKAWAFHVGGRYPEKYSVKNTNIAVRPAIEILKSKISY